MPETHFPLAGSASGLTFSQVTRLDWVKARTLVSCSLARPLIGGDGGQYVELGRSPGRPAGRHQAEHGRQHQEDH